ncbi:MAG TPA: hypothetical protein DCF45_06105 [Gammaproteobacteria bacterium]|nr:hypothetical protein [Gammaproteobacteria bacterium]
MMRCDLIKSAFALLLVVLLVTPVASFADPELWEVRKGESLSGIVRQLLPESRADRVAMMASIVRANPHAFADGDPNRMFAGVVLAIPDTEALARQETVPSTPSAAKSVADSGRKIVQDSDSEAQTAAAGRVLYTKGRATAATAEGDVRELTKGGQVFDGDTVTTGPGSFMRVRYSDGATMLLRPRSRLQIEDYQYQGNSDSDRSLLRLVKGGFRTVTGAIGQTNKEAYRVATPMATIGIRGTDFSALFCAGDCVNMPDGLYTSTDQGSTVVSSGGESAVVDAGESVYVPLVGGAPQPLKIKPRLLSLPDPGCD